MVLVRILVLAIGLGPATAAVAQAEPPPARYPKLVDEARSADGFVPAGWRLESKVAGDLNKDGIEDLALVLRDNNPANVLDNAALGPPKFDTNPRILAVAFGRSGGGYGLVLENHTLIPRTTEPNLDDYLDQDGVAILRGTLQVKLHLFANAGGWTAGSIAYTFRFQDGRFALIGYDSNMFQRNTGETTDISINYSTRKMSISTGTMQSDARKVRWQTLPRRPLLSLDQIGDGMAFDPAKLPR